MKASLERAARAASIDEDQPSIESIIFMLSLISFAERTALYVHRGWAITEEELSVAVRWPLTKGAS